MGDFGILRHREHVVAVDCARVPDQKDAVPLPLQKRHSLLSAQTTPVPTVLVLRVKISGHDKYWKAEASPGLPFSPSRYPQAKPSTHTKTLAPRARLVNRRHPQQAVRTSICGYRTTAGKQDWPLLAFYSGLGTANHILRFTDRKPATTHQAMTTNFKNWNGGYGKTKKIGPHSQDVTQ